MSALTLTTRQRIARPAKYEAKAKRTRIYRALYGLAAGNDPQGRPELNSFRKLPERFKHGDAVDLFVELACDKDNPLYPNGLFSPQTHAVLVERLATLKKFKGG